MNNCRAIQMRYFRMILLFTVCLFLFLQYTGCKYEDTGKLQSNGLAGGKSRGLELTNFKEFSILTSLEQSWGKADGLDDSWSGYWEGYIVGPTDGVVSFYIETNKRLTIIIDREHLTHVEGEVMHVYQMEEGVQYPVEIKYFHDQGEGYFNIRWSWEGSEINSIPPDKLIFYRDNKENWSWLMEPDEDTIDYDKFLRVPGQNVLIYHDSQYFSAWPANNGIWIWGEEILVGFTRSIFREDKLGHSIDRSIPGERFLARSRDGGETWQIEQPDVFTPVDKKPRVIDTKINFAHPDFALQLIRTNYYYSYDRGITWYGPFLFPDVGYTDITARTDYLVINNDECLFFISTPFVRVRSRLTDRAFSAMVTDGGIGAEFLSWISDNDTVRSVMPSTVQLDDESLVTVLRRRYDPPYGFPEQRDDKPKQNRHWIDAYQSNDMGNTWEFLSTVAETDRGARNGNPGSIVQLKDGRLCVTYAFRGVPFSIRARISSDNGKTWGDEIILRDDAISTDLGYTQSVVRPDGKIVTVYYINTNGYPEQHIAATIWDPDEVY